jgi:hypothetical protein
MIHLSIQKRQITYHSKEPATAVLAGSFKYWVQANAQSFLLLLK